MAISALPAPPARTDTPDAFVSKSDAFLAALPNFVSETNATVASMNMLAAGGAYALPYTFSALTANSDPGTGVLRLSPSNNQNQCTAIYVDLTGADARDYTSILDAFDASTSAVKGSVRIVKANDPSKFLTFDVTACTTLTGYRYLSISNTGGSAVSPFVTGDSIVMFFQRNGDKGDAGAAGSTNLVLLNSSSISAGTTNFDLLNVFTSAYDKYFIEVQNVTLAAAGLLQFNFAKAGAIDTTSLYNYGFANGPMSTYSGSISVGTGTQPVHTLTLEVRNANSTGPKSVGSRGIYYNPSGGSVGASICEGVYTGNVAATGFRLYGNGTTFSSGTVRVYGVKNT